MKISKSFVGFTLRLRRFRHLLLDHKTLKVFHEAIRSILIVLRWGGGLCGQPSFVAYLCSVGH